MEQLMNFQTAKYIHAMNREINGLYFSENIKEFDHGYYFFSKYSSIKDKWVIFNKDDYPKSLKGDLTFHEKVEGSQKRVEILYDLNETFNRENYESKKKFQNRIKSPETLARKQNLIIREATDADYLKIEKLHNEWVKTKLENPKSHKNSFSVKRYIRCVQKGLNNSTKYMVLVAESEGEIVGARVFTIADDVLFDAAFFVKFWSVSQLSEAINVSILKFVKEKGFKFLNLGLATGTSKIYKKHLPHTEVYVYRKVIR